MNTPPLGVIPKLIWHYDRIKELSRAIYEYASINKFDLCEKWSKELLEQIEIIKNFKEN